MDNDRNSRYPLCFASRYGTQSDSNKPHAVPGITLQDRMRFLQAYLGRTELAVADREFARWLEEKTRKRRKECDGVDPTVNFRRLMRWTPGSV